MKEAALFKSAVFSQRSPGLSTGHQTNKLKISGLEANFLKFTVNEQSRLSQKSPSTTTGIKAF